MASAFLRLPAELRHEIFKVLLPPQIHLHLIGDRACMSICSEPERDEDSSASLSPSRRTSHSGVERRNDHMNPDRALWARRLRSTWGPHWMCEEQAIFNSTSRLHSDIFLISKTLYLEIIEVLARTATVNITDMRVIERWDCDEALSANKIVSIILLNAVRLRITLRLPLNCYQALDQLSVRQTDEPEVQNGCSSELSAWMRLGQSLRHADNLTELHIWLDHSDACTWSVVNERKLLSPLLAQLARHQNDVNISIILPKLHPRFERADQHFMDGGLTGAVHLHRTLRQRWHALNDNDRVEHKADFPFMIDIYSDQTIEQVEVGERKLWNRGDDVEVAMEEIVLW